MQMQCIQLDLLPWLWSSLLTVVYGPDPVKFRQLMLLMYSTWFTVSYIPLLNVFSVRSNNSHCFVEQVAPKCQPVSNFGCLRLGLESDYSHKDEDLRLDLDLKLH